MSTSLWPLQKCCWASFRPPVEVPNLPTWWRATSGKGSDFLRVRTVLDAIGETQKNSPVRPRAMENMRYGSSGYVRAPGNTVEDCATFHFQRNALGGFNCLKQKRKLLVSPGMAVKGELAGFPGWGLSPRES